MERVGQHLSAEAARQADVDRVDVFGKSSFNRFYYSLYLLVRDFLYARNTGWLVKKHKEVPIFLRSTVRKAILSRINFLEKNGHLTSGKAHQAKSRAIQGTDDLAMLLSEAYDVRCKADYEVAFRAVKVSGKIELDRVTLEEAASWPKRGRSHVETIRRVLDELGI